MTIIRLANTGADGREGLGLISTDVKGRASIVVFDGAENSESLVVGLRKRDEGGG